MTKRIGIPIARIEVTPGQKAGRYTHVCPVCGERIEETADSYGESITNNYGKHYAETHEEEA